MPRDLAPGSAPPVVPLVGDARLSGEALADFADFAEDLEPTRAMQREDIPNEPMLLARRAVKSVPDAISATLESQGPDVVDFEARMKSEPPAAIVAPARPSKFAVAPPVGVGALPAPGASSAGEASRAPATAKPPPPLPARPGDASRAGPKGSEEGSLAPATVETEPPPPPRREIHPPAVAQRRGQQPRAQRGALVFLGVCALAATGLIGVSVGRSTAPVASPPPPAVAVRTLDAVPAATAPAAAAAPAPVLGAAVAPVTAPAGAPSPAPSQPLHPSVKGAPAKLSDGEARGEKPIPAPATAPVPSAPDLEPDGPVAPAFDAPLATSALSALSASVQGCGNGGGGTARVAVTFAPSGRVTQAVVEGAPYAGTPAGGCVAAKARGARVPAFSGPAVTVRKTFPMNLEIAAGPRFVAEIEMIEALPAVASHPPTSPRATTASGPPDGAVLPDAAPSPAEDLLAIARKRLYPNYRPASFVLSSGRGAELFDTEGRRYLDMAAGVAVCTLGHAHPEYAAAIGAQVAKLSHVSNYFYNEPNIRLADELCTRTGFDRAFFCNSGAEANEALLKLARRHHYAKGDTARVRLIAFDGSFHGRTMGALALTGQAKYQAGFGPGVTGVTHVPYGDLDAVKIAMGPDVAGIFVEPVQGEGGVVPAPPGFLAGLRALADAHGSLLLIDEVQTGIGRTGAFLGHEHDGVRADAIALAKGLGGGFPVGAMLCREELATALPPGTHGSTYGGNALASAACLAVLDVLDREQLVNRAATLGRTLGAMLERLAKDHADIVEGERGRGLLRALVLRPGHDARPILERARDRGLLLTVAGERALRFSPPLVVTEAQLSEAVDRLALALAT